MKLEIIKEKEDKLLNRKELFLNIKFEKSTPSKESIKKQLCENLKLDPELLKLDEINQGFGERKAVVLAYLYKSKDQMNKIEKKNKKLKQESKKPEEKKE